MEAYGAIIHEWRNLMTRRRPFDLWYGDQGALNAILDKWVVKKHALSRILWNQTGLTAIMEKENHCRLVQADDDLHVWHEPTASKIMGWHGTGWYKIWHQLGIDHYRKDNDEEREKFFIECQGKSPSPITKTFNYFLFLDKFNRPLKRNGHLLGI
jgi:hypothetical protein